MAKDGIKAKDYMRLYPEAFEDGPDDIPPAAFFVDSLITLLEPNTGFIHILYSILGPIAAHHFYRLIRTTYTLNNRFCETEVQLL